MTMYNDFTKNPPMDKEVVICVPEDGRDCVTLMYDKGQLFDYAGNNIGNPRFPLWVKNIKNPLPLIEGNYES